MKKLWSGIRSIINIKDNKHPMVHSLTENGISINNPQDVVNKFNHFFVNIGKSTDKTIGKSNKHFSTFLNGNYTNSFFFLHCPVTPAEVSSVISSLKNSKSVGPYSIPVFLLN